MARASPEDQAIVKKLLEDQLAKHLVLLNATAEWYPIYQSLRKTLLTGDRAEIDRLFTELGECSWEPDEPWDKELTARTCQLSWLFSKYAFSDRVSVQIRGAARDTLGLFAKAADRISPGGITNEMRLKLGYATGDYVFWCYREEPDAERLLPWEGIRTFSEYWQKYQLWATDPDYGKPVSAAK